MKGILIFLIVFGLLVFVHEFGHFIVAKKSGILVREFSIGMGPKLFQIRRNPTTIKKIAHPNRAGSPVSCSNVDGKIFRSVNG